MSSDSNYKSRKCLEDIKARKIKSLNESIINIKILY